MAEKTIRIEFKGYWRDKNKNGLPANSGIYCVYECSRNVSDGTIKILRLIYIGEAQNVNDRVANHEKYEDWLSYVQHVEENNELCFSFGGVGATDRARAEAAMIFKHKPPENVEYVNDFPFDKTTMSLSGKTSKLEENFTVNRT